MNLPLAALLPISIDNFILDVHDFCDICPSFDLFVLFEVFQDLILILSPVLSLHASVLFYKLLYYYLKIYTFQLKGALRQIVT